MAAPEQWWVILTQTGKFNTTGRVVQSASKPVAGGGETVQGPFATRAAAEAALHQQANPGPPPIPPISIPNPFSWVGAVAHWIGDAVLHVTDVNMWISVGWILLGLALVALGINLWLKIPQKLGAAAITAAKAA